ncbi:hypothetical protein [Roseateles terrae]|uniref:Flagellar hook-length control protein-like C-terminal domain-containing protein n=1 Tax=Roseateles terrae TaxID=431060 RepID=A0ABR6GPS6_9BURK|nr:hypothetical protein [Roseateles terrae]MBB3194105.1 hypothetical protein [Roseateles terrae]
MPISRQPGQQQRLGRLQQGLDYLDRLASSVQQIKSGLSDTLARRTAPSESLNQQVEQLRQLWSQRPEAAAGRVDAQLQAAASPDASARQRFKLRGLDLAVLQQPGRETLRLQLPGQAVPQGEGTSPKPVQLAVTLQGEGTQEQLQVLAKALAPAGLEVVVQGQDIIFQMAEAQWPALRDGLTVRGEGKRFPSGQPVRAMLEPAPEALQPQRWNLQDVKGQREALGQLLQAEPRLAQARQTLGQQLVQQVGLGADPQMGPQMGHQKDPLTGAQMGAQKVHHLAPRMAQPPAPALQSSLQATTPAVTNAEEARDLVGDITSSLQSLDFHALGALLPAVQGLHRQRVQQLLTPR